MVAAHPSCASCKSRKAEYQRNDDRHCAQCLLHNLVREGLIIRIEIGRTPWSVVIPD